MLRPMPAKFGVGYTCSNTSLPSEELVQGYQYKNVGMHHNYYVSTENWKCPHKVQLPSPPHLIDGFSPNLNKVLHVGHLRNLAIANSLSKILTCQQYRYDQQVFVEPSGWLSAYVDQPSAKFVALLGATLGVKKAALDGWKYWTDFLGYHPTEYFDVALPNDVVECEEVTDPDRLEFGSFVWKGPKGDIIVKRSSGTPLYAYYDLAFKSYIGPSHYITGHEQKEHFENLGLAEKHLPMGLVLGDDGKKLKSRTGDAISATEVAGMIVARLDGDLRTCTKLAWNILSWNFLHVSRDKNIKFDVETWTKPDQGGLYVSYTYARAVSALKKKNQHLKRLYYEVTWQKSWAGMNYPFCQADIDLLGFSEQYNFYFQEAINRLDPAPLANFAYDLARQISQAYEREKIDGGRKVFAQVIEHATWRLEMCMKDLGMFALHEV